MTGLCIVVLGNRVAVNTGELRCRAGTIKEDHVVNEVRFDPFAK